MHDRSLRDAQNAAPAPDSLRRDAQTIGLVGLVHGTSHFFHLLLPPLFPWFIREFGLSYAELGLVVSVFFVISGVGQALSGVLVDRVGARPVLFAALGCFVVASLAAASAQGYSGLVLASALAGLGNAPFHPVDFTILNRRIAAPRLGHAYSVHGLCGNLGWAVSPLVSAGLLALTGSLRATYIGIAGLGLLVLAVAVLCRGWLDDRALETGEAPPAKPVSAGSSTAAGRGAGATLAPGSRLSVWGLLRMPSVWLCFSFLFWSTAALSAVQSFAAPALHLLHGLDLKVAAMVVTGYMVCGASGMVAGGFLLARLDQRLEPLIAAALAGSAAMLLLAASGWVGGTAALVVASLAGLGTGLAGPSRDMLIRRATPPGATGRVYGLVYSGLDLGFALASPLFGRLLDAGQPAAVFQGAALTLGVAVLSAAWVGRAGVARRRADAAA
ncbi:MAG TPA: MFS transporter [Burkholderiaceae bacterium]|nr:MFS transporter [Burkholderiaceae bacterium]HMZ00445.1 MFS transporter [Burkholderiaceae bacterium]HNB45192.1 MFS transporter [Burkholderiaceae bacterium]HNG80921.1 MFS transporter [Burkholderiaceae bacterium]